MVDKVDDLIIYGSFKDKEPSQCNNQHVFKGCARIEIAEPLGRSRFTFMKKVKTDEKGKKKITRYPLIYYIQMVSKHGMELKL